MEDMRARVIVALDTPTRDAALRLVDVLGDDVVFYKVGLELYIAAGDAVLDVLRAAGKKIFLDLKLFDIPNTVKGAAASLARKGADAGGPAGRGQRRRHGQYQAAGCDHIDQPG